MSTNWLLEQLENPPNDLGDKETAAIRRAMTEGKVQMLSAERETGLFCLYLLGDSYEAISEKTGWSLDVVAVTALKYRWLEKKEACCVGGESSGAQQVLKNMMGSVLAATVHSIMTQTRDVMSGKIEASECKMIPKNIREMQQFVAVVSQIYALQAKTEQQSQVVNVNIANIPNNPQIAASTEPMKVIEAAPESRLEKFKMLKNMEG